VRIRDSRRSAVGRFGIPADVAPFFALPHEPSAEDWVDAIELVPVGTYAAVQRTGVSAPKH
jgi:hypothetical protein